MQILLQPDDRWKKEPLSLSLRSPAQLSLVAFITSKMAINTVSAPVYYGFEPKYLFFIPWYINLSKVVYFSVIIPTCSTFFN